MFKNLQTASPKWLDSANASFDLDLLLSARLFTPPSDSCIETHTSLNIFFLFEAVP